MDFLKNIVDRFSLDNSFVQLGILLIVLGYAIRQFLIWQKSQNKNKRRSKILVDSNDYIRGSSTSQRIKSSTIDLKKNKKENLVKLEDQKTDQDGKINKLQSELDTRLETIQALEKDIEHWHKDWSGLEEELKKKDQKLVEMESLLGEQATIHRTAPDTQSPSPNKQPKFDDTDNLGDYISTWIQKANDSSPFDSFRASNDAENPKAAKSKQKKTKQDKPHQETQSLLDASELLGDDETPSDTELNEQLHYEHVIAELQTGLLDKQRTIDELRAAQDGKALRNLQDQLSASEQAFQRLQAEAEKLQPLQKEVQLKDQEIAKLKEDKEQEVAKLKENKEQEVAKLKSDLESHAETTTHLEQHIDDWQGRYQALEKQFSEKTNLIESLESDIEDKIETLKEYEALIDTNNDAAEQITKLQSKLYELESAQTTQQEEILTVQQQAEEARQEAEALRLQINEKNQALDEALAKPKVDWQSRYQTLESKFDEHKSLSKKLTDKLEADLAERATQLSQLEADLTERANQLFQLESQSSSSNEWEQKYLSLKSENNTLANEKTQLASELSKKQESLTALEAELQSVWDRWTEMESSIKQHDSERDDLQNGILEKQAAITELENQLLAQRTEYETATARLHNSDKNEKELAQLKSEIERLKQENNELSTQMLEADSELQQTITSQGNQKLKVNELQELIRQREDKIGFIQTELNEKSSALQAINMQLAAKDQQTSQLEKIVAQKNNELESIRHKALDSSDQEVVYKTEAAGLSQRIDELEEALKLKEQTIEDLTDKLTSSSSQLNQLKEIGDDEAHTVTQIISTLSATAGVDSNVEDWQEGVQEINSALKNSNQEVQKLKAQLEHMREYEMTANIQEEAMSKLKEELKTRDDNIKKMKSQLNNWESQWNQFTDTMVFEGDKIEKQSESIDDLKQKMKNLDASEASDTIRDAAVDTLKRDIAAASSSVKELEESLHTLKPASVDSPNAAPKLTKVIKRGKKWFSK